MSRLNLSFLGAFQATLADRPLTGFESNKVRALLAYLVMEPNRPHGRHELAGLLWPDFPDDVARKNLRQALNNLRHVLDDQHVSPPFLLITHDAIQWNPDSSYWLDVAGFTTLLAACDGHAHRHPERCDSCAGRWQQAAELYRGDFLAHFFLDGSTPFGEWALLQQERLHRQVLPALYRLATYYERHGLPEQAQRYAARQLELNPWREEAHRQLIWALAAGGQRSDALAQYHSCRRILAQEFGAEPEKATTDLYERIKAGEQGSRACHLDKLGTSSEPDEGGVEVNGVPVHPSTRRLPNRRACPEAAEGLPIPSPGHNLPTPPTPLIGREEELRQVSDALASTSCRLLTITGPGGIGKTCLALQAARDNAWAFDDGACFVPLAPVLTADFLIPAIVEALALPLSGQSEPRRLLLSHLRNREILLVLDNMEHLQAGIPLLGEMLRHAPRLTLLVTSRERLKLYNEWVFDLQGLPVAEDPAVADAVELFLYHTHRVQNGFAVSHAEEAQIARICQLVGGLPLAIELAAAWSRLLSYAEIAMQIKWNLRFLTAEGRAGEERHASLQAVFDQSWRLLSPAEQEALAALSVFRGGFDSEAAAAVAGATLPILAALLDKSLLRRCPNGRLSLHVLVRQYAGEKLAETGKLPTVRQRHLAYFVALTESAETQLNGSTTETRLSVLKANHDNLRVALGWAMESSNQEQVTQFTYALNRYWHQGEDMNQRMAQDGLLREDMEEASATLANSTSFWQRKDGTDSIESNRSLPALKPARS